ncbi:MAG: glycosyltransferase [Deltaproteobacteria bacterium]|nr:glycosyltransferase [Deltaproteobacteria bacterium]
MLSIVIPFRNEDMLSFTVRRLQETLTVTHEVIVVDDASDQAVDIPPGVTPLRFDRPTGAQRARHAGIVQAKYDTVLVMDAHMNFWDEDWGPVLVDYSLSHPDHVGCFTMLPLTREKMRMEEAKGRYFGAHIVPFDVNDQPGLHSILRRRILVDKWNKTRQAGEVGSVLGGAYFFQRSWYLDVLKSPWEELMGWGFLEANISIPNFLLGGKNVCIELEIGHMFRNAPPYVSDLGRMLFNQLYLAEVVIPDDKERKALISLLELPDDAITRRAQGYLDRSIFRWYRRYLIENGKRSWQQYKEEWMDPERPY